MPLWLGAASPSTPRPIALLLCLSCSLACPSALCEVADTSAASCSRARVKQQEEDESSAARLSLLQVVGSNLQFRAPAQQSGLTQHEAIDLPATEYLQAAVPLAWTHVPKCGTTIQNSIVRLPGVCPGVPMGDTAFGTKVLGDPDFEETFPDWNQRCPGLKSFGDKDYKRHINVGSHFEDAYNGHGVIMLRQPEQRVMSMYYHAIDARPLPVEQFSELSAAMVENAIWGARLIDKYSMSVLDFAKATAGCEVRMLTKEGDGWPGCMGVDYELEFTAALKVSDVDAVEARRRLRGYAFVGITDNWDLSVCLLHAMFGGECNPAEFTSVRTCGHGTASAECSNSTASACYDTNELQGFVDQHDGALYEEALSIFTENLLRYGVSEESCQQCFHSIA